MGTRVFECALRVAQICETSFVDQHVPKKCFSKGLHMIPTEIEKLGLQSHFESSIYGTVFSLGADSSFVPYAPFSMENSSTQYLHSHHTTSKAMHHSSDKQAFVLA